MHKPACSATESSKKIVILFLAYQRRCYSLIWKYHIVACNKRNSSQYASLCIWADCCKQILTRKTAFRDANHVHHTFLLGKLDKVVNHYQYFVHILKTLLDSAEESRIARELISWSISPIVWGWAGVKLATPGWKKFNHLRNEFDFWKVHGIMNTLGLISC